MLFKKIITGGQTGVDRGALDAALSKNFPCGGWCPDGRKAEDGVISDKYPLQVLANGNYSDRTMRNVSDSDGTAIIVFNGLMGGTAKTLDYCLTLQKPYILINGCESDEKKAATMLVGFIEQNNIEKLNIAGPRESQMQGAHDYAFKVVISLLDLSIC